MSFFKNNIIKSVSETISEEKSIIGENYGDTGEHDFG